MYTKTSNKFSGINFHFLLYSPLLVVFIFCSDLTIINVFNSPISDGDTMRVSPKIVVDMLGLTESFFSEDHPIFSIQHIFPLLKSAMFFLVSYGYSQEFGLEHGFKMIHKVSFVKRFHGVCRIKAIVFSFFRKLPLPFSFVIPPLRSMQCTWGWNMSFCDHV